MNFSSLLPSVFLIEEAPVDDHSSALHPEELRYVEKAVEKRRNEFSTGRFLARKALKRLGVDAAAIPCDAKRAPQWPQGVRGSITHTQSWCAVALASGGGTFSIGIDAENARRFTMDLWPSVFTQEEIGWLRTQPSDDQRLLAGVCFSAKESFYKYQFPITGRFLEFHQVEIKPDSQSRRLNFKAKDAQLERLTPSGAYSVQEDLVCTACWSLE